MPASPRNMGGTEDPDKGSFSDLRASEVDCRELRSEWDMRKQKQRMWANHPRSSALNRQRERRQSSWRRIWISPGKGTCFPGGTLNFRDPT